ncbi:MAG: ABC transporter permease [Holophagales bacterium]|jgi:ABC-type transport system involved in multi-copper enzyme maturation permease subunit|nr:ABC transporter permease [Holophagales bacterium]
MLKNIILHETLLHLTSFRFQIIVGLLVIILFSGLAVNISNYKNKVSEYNEVLAADDSYRIAVPPNPLCVFAEGMDSYSSMSVAMDILVSDFKVKTLGKNNVSIRLSAFETLDFGFVVKVLMSLSAIIITFASVSGERFSGTLKLACASGASKKNLMLGKLMASFICLSVPFLICAIISCIVLALNNMLAGQTDIIRICLFVLFSLIYILFFLLVGLIISTITRRPQESLVTGVLVWLLLVFVMPSLSPQVSKLFADLPSTRAMEEARIQGWIGMVYEHENSVDRDFNRRLGKMQSGFDSEWEKSRNQFAGYAKIKRWIDLFSPSDIFNNASIEIVGNGIQNALHTKNAVLQYKNNLLRESDFSEFSFQRLGFLKDLLPSLTSMFVFCVELCILLLVAYRKFMLLDLREG